jgi:hypothetical protein
MNGMTETCTTSSAVEMRTAGSKTGTKSESALSRSSAMRGTMIIMVASMNNVTDSAPLKEGVMQEECALAPKWLEVYQLTIVAAGGDSYVMKNYLPIYLSSLAGTWLLGLPSGYVRS